ncbi:MAG: sigma-70 family RNA polymerase sigma factor [Pirellulales bacterium]
MQYSTPETRASLILRLQDARDVAAWDCFESVYAPVIHRVALRQGLQPSDAENVVQEVMMRVARSVNQWLVNQQRGPFRAWLIRIARNETLRLLTRPATKAWNQFGDSASQLANVPNYESKVVGELTAEYQREVFLWAAERVRAEVEESTWLAFWLTHVEGLSVREAAKQLNVKPGNIYFGRSRVMNRLKLSVLQFEEE